MRWLPERHLADATLLLLQEGELSPERQRRAQTHLSLCAICRARLEALATLAVSLSEPVAETHPCATVARDRLADRLAVAASQAREDRRRTRWVQQHTRLLVRAAAVLLLLGLAVAFRPFDLPLQDRMAAWEDTGPEPDRALTPGATRPASLQELCGRSDEDLDPELPAEKEEAVFHAYGIRGRAARAYQVDYLINPQLGGSDELANLWPEPYHATVWNARAKDALERRLHGMVCSGEVDLQSAQRELATDWIAAYKRYFHVSRPVSAISREGSQVAQLH